MCGSATASTTSASVTVGSGDGVVSRPGQPPAAGWSSWTAHHCSTVRPAAHDKQVGLDARQHMRGVVVGSSVVVVVVVDVVVVVGGTTAVVVVGSWIKQQSY